MGNHTVNKSESKKIGKAAQIGDETILTCMSVFERIKEETIKDWELEAKGKANIVVLQDLKGKDKSLYSVFKAYDGGNPNKKPIKDSSKKEDITH